MKERGDAKFILGMEINHDKRAGTLMIKQTRCIDDSTQGFGQQIAKTTDNPCASRLDIAYVVTQLSSVFEQSGIQHLRAAIRMPRHLKSTCVHAIVYEGGINNIMVEAFADADWESNIDDRQSVSGMIVVLSNESVVYKSKF